MKTVIFHLLTKSAAALLLLLAFLIAPLLADILIRVWINRAYLGVGLPILIPILLRFIFLFVSGSALLFWGLSKPTQKIKLSIVALVLTAILIFGFSVRALQEKENDRLSEKAHNVRTLSDEGLLAEFERAINNYTEPTINNYKVSHVVTTLDEFKKRNLKNDELMIRAFNSFSDPRIKLTPLKLLSKDQQTPYLKKLIFESDKPIYRIAAATVYRDLYKKDALPLLIEAFKQEQDEEVAGNLEYLFRAYYLREEKLIQENSLGKVITENIERFKGKKPHRGLVSFLAESKEPGALPYIEEFAENNILGKYGYDSIQFIKYYDDFNSLPSLYKFREQLSSRKDFEAKRTLDLIDDRISYFEYIKGTTN